MSLVGVRAQNHPQQRVKDHVDDRGTAPEVFDPLHERFRFTVDVAAAPHNAKLPRYYTRESDGLAQSWAGERVWCNPPYSDLRAWVAKARDEWLSGRCPLVVMLLPNNRFEQGWWHDVVEPHYAAGDVRLVFLRGRMRFIRPDAIIGPKGDRPPFGCCLLIWGDA